MTMQMIDHNKTVVLSPKEYVLEGSGEEGDYGVSYFLAAMYEHPAGGEIKYLCGDIIWFKDEEEVFHIRPARGRHAIMFGAKVETLADHLVGNYDVHRVSGGAPISGQIPFVRDKETVMAILSEKFGIKVCAS